MHRNKILPKFSYRFWGLFNFIFEICNFCFLLTLILWWTILFFHFCTLCPNCVHHLNQKIFVYACLCKHVDTLHCAPAQYTLCSTQNSPPHLNSLNQTRAGTTHYTGGGSMKNWFKWGNWNVHKLALQKILPPHKKEQGAPARALVKGRLVPSFVWGCLTA